MIAAGIPTAQAFIWSLSCEHNLWRTAPEDTVRQASKLLHLGHTSPKGGTRVYRKSQITEVKAFELLGEEGGNDIHGQVHMCAARVLRFSSQPPLWKEQSQTSSFEKVRVTWFGLVWCFLVGQIQHSCFYLHSYIMLAKMQSRWVISLPGSPFLWLTLCVLVMQAGCWNWDLFLSFCFPHVKHSTLPIFTLLL